MAPKIGMDADGDIPPCSVMQGYEYAAKWDAWKEKKYNGTQKAQPCVERFKHIWEKKMVPIVPIQPLKKKVWWIKIISYFR